MSQLESDCLFTFHFLISVPTLSVLSLRLIRRDSTQRQGIRESERDCLGQCLLKVAGAQRCFHSQRNDEMLCNAGRRRTQSRKKEKEVLGYLVALIILVPESEDAARFLSFASKLRGEMGIVKRRRGNRMITIGNKNDQINKITKILSSSFFFLCVLDAPAPLCRSPPQMNLLANDSKRAASSLSGTRMTGATK